MATNRPARGSTKGVGTPAYILHSHDWSESSLILDVFTREHGRVVAVAKGAKRPYSQLRPVLMPFQRLSVSFGAKRGEDAEVWLLRQAEWAGGSAWPGGAALLPGFYLNELLMRLLPRHDPHPALFDLYGQILPALAEGALLQAALRAFEIALLRELGLLPDLAVATVGGQALAVDQFHDIHPELGVRPVDGARAGGFAVALRGGTLLALEASLEMAHGGSERAVGALMAACLPALPELKTVLRALLHYHLGSHTLRTRQLMMELQQA